MENKCNKPPSNKITDIVRLHRLLKKWKRVALDPKPNPSGNSTYKFLKRTLTFSENTSSASTPVPKGCFAVCVGEEMKRYVVPTEYLSHVAFVDLLREAEEEFGFQQEGVLRIPCEVAVFESVLQVVMKKKEVFGSLVYCSVEVDATRAQHQLEKSMCT
ncbi:SAUR-like auxin-responsive protein family [Rhynchospora pubera]|uniref:SAUR-like auxin-responsive protein family n=1 Tax=Rhynchospora pubera TaxID=906938 RepID=A0AAV8FLC9_9POAL|nr:SAUR-like auxin-responsive protein family [Rhynchospora pubera]